MAFRRLVIAGIVLLLAGAVLLALADATTTEAVAMALVGVGGVLLVSAAFYAVGRSEDEERARRH
jgi:uncharacterized membrane protein